MQLCLESLAFRFAEEVNNLHPSVATAKLRLPKQPHTQGFIGIEPLLKDLSRLQNRTVRQR